MTLTSLAYIDTRIQVNSWCHYLPLKTSLTKLNHFKAALLLQRHYFIRAHDLCALQEHLDEPHHPEQLDDISLFFKQHLGLHHRFLFFTLPLRATTPSEAIQCESLEVRSLRWLHNILATVPVSVQLGNQSLIEVLSVKNRYQNSEKTE